MMVAKVFIASPANLAGWFPPCSCCLQTSSRRSPAHPSFSPSPRKRLWPVTYFTSCQKNFVGSLGLLGRRTPSLSRFEGERSLERRGRGWSSPNEPRRADTLGRLKKDVGCARYR